MMAGFISSFVDNGGILTAIGVIVFVISLLAVSGFFLIYPLLILAISIFKKKIHTQHNPENPSTSMIIVVRNGEDLIRDKIENANSIEYPSDQFEIIIFSDGSTDRTVETIKPFLNDRVQLYSCEDHTGKFKGINRAVAESGGEIIIFSDADAILDQKAVIKITKHFTDHQVGGVCGRRIIGEREKCLAEAQGHYFSLDTWSKNIESRGGSITSNDGKLFAIRRELFSPVPPGVTDDLYTALNVIKNKKRFIFEHEAHAFVRLPSRSVKHEIERRRRIVSASLLGILLMRDVLNPFKYGFYSLNLFLNKILRRLLPVFLVLLFASSLYLAFFNPFFFIVFFLQILFYSTALMYPLFFKKSKSRGIINRICSIIFYFCVGNIGMLFGVFDFLTGKQIAKWTPVKKDTQEGTQ